jgi:hypothetical protein
VEVVASFMALSFGNEPALAGFVLNRQDRSFALPP